MKCYNPFAFTPMAVTITIVGVYLAVFIPLLIIHETVPSAPKSPTVYRGLNLTEAWLDLAELTNGYHPFNSARNDEVRNWLLRRIESILESNEVHFQTQGYTEGVGAAAVDSLGPRSSPAATIFNDLESNYTSTALLGIGLGGRKPGYSTYFEGSNIIVYVRGTEDEEGEWWNSKPYRASHKTHGRGGVLVNAHFDSVSTGYGATDDGMGVITALQLIKYYTTSGNTPKKGLVALFNNGEEDGLYGAKAFVSHPIASFVHTFLNLEGAGAGGRATLFRSTDAEVTRAYGASPHPFGTIISGDGFAAGIIRSETDYVVFRGEGFRGLDVAFLAPRARYHTNEDDAKHASKSSLWHMLSASLETTKYLTSRVDDFVGPRSDRDNTKVNNGRRSDGVWFDLFGRVFAVFGLRTLFAWSLTLLIVSPLTLALVTWILVSQEKYYLFAGKVKQEGNEDVSLHGWRGFFRFPIAVTFSGALTVGAAFLMRKINPLIVYSSQYAVWATSISLFFCTFWFIMAGANFVRPSALHRTYSLLWMFVFGWIVLVGATVLEDRYKIGSGYLIVFYVSAVFLAALIGLLELFALPKKSSVADEAHDEQENRNGLNAVPNYDGSAPSIQPSNTAPRDEEEEASETTPLVGRISNTVGTTFSRGYRRASIPSVATDGAHDEHKSHPYGDEQDWSSKLPSWTWFIQFLLVGPFTLIIIGQVGLLLVTATSQTGTDGSPLLFPYLVVALFTILILLPAGPFVHRISHQLPTFLFLVFIATLIYNLTAFPFSANNRYKAYFQQTVDLETGKHAVLLTGLEEYVRPIIASIPSASGQTIECDIATVRSGVISCSYIGPAPNVLPNTTTGVPPEKFFSTWLSFNVTRPSSTERKAIFSISAQHTKSCAIRFSHPISHFKISGAAAPKSGSSDVPEGGIDTIKLWHRDFNKTWEVEVEWEGDGEDGEGRDGKVVCGWAEWEMGGRIEALEEIVRFAPVWAGVSKAAEGLVEGWKSFKV